MKKSIVAALILATTFVFSFPALAVDTVSPLESQKSVTVRTVADTVNNPRVFALANGSSLVTWQEESEGGYYLRARTISATNRLGSIRTINSEKAVAISQGAGVQDSVSINRNGKLFAVWVTQSLRYGVQSQRVWGRTSVDGINWSKPYIVISALSVYGDFDTCVQDPTNTPRCGYLRIQTAIDDKGRQAVLVADNLETTGTRYRMKATNFVGEWSSFKTLSPVPELRTSEILGLTSGFIVSATKYSGIGTNYVKVSYYSPKVEAWTNTLTAIASYTNTVFTSHWVQRDTKNLTIAIASSSDLGGVTMRNFNVDSKSWTSNLISVQAGAPDHVVQDIKAAKDGSNFIVIFNVYNQTNGITEVRVAKVVGVTPTTTVVGTSSDQINLLYAGATQNYKGVVAYNHILEGAKLGGITASTAPIFLPNSATNSYLSALIKTKSDKVAAVGLKYGSGTTTIVFTQGYRR